MQAVIRNVSFVSVTFKIAEYLILINGAGVSNVFKKLNNRVL